MNVEPYFKFLTVRRALVLNFGWAIHVSPPNNVNSIKASGLIANRDAPIPNELVRVVPSPHILCMHPLGARNFPPAVGGENGYAELVTFAVKMEDIPQQVQIDWSFYGQNLSTQINEREDPEEAVRKLLFKWGSFVSYQTIMPDKLRVFADAYPPAKPDDWPMLLSGVQPYRSKR